MLSGRSPPSRPARTPRSASARRGPRAALLARAEAYWRGRPARRRSPGDRRAPRPSPRAPRRRSEAMRRSAGGPTPCAATAPTGERSSPRRATGRTRRDSTSREPPAARGTVEGSHRSTTATAAPRRSRSEVPEGTPSPARPRARPSSAQGPGTAGPRGSTTPCRSATSSCGPARRRQVDPARAEPRIRAVDAEIEGNFRAAFADARPTSTRSSQPSSRGVGPHVPDRSRRPLGSASRSRPARRENTAGSRSFVGERRSWRCVSCSRYSPGAPVAFYSARRGRPPRRRHCTASSPAPGVPSRGASAGVSHLNGPWRRPHSLRRSMPIAGRAGGQRG